MNTRTRTFAFVVLFTAMACFGAEDLNMGSWKLNEAKSKIGPGIPKNTTVVYEVAGGNVKLTVDGVGADGAPRHSEWMGKFDGKDYPVTGDPASDTRAYKRVNDHTLSLTAKKGGKVTMYGLIVTSDDGKSRNVDMRGKNASGKSFSFFAVYDKQ